MDQNTPGTPPIDEPALPGFSPVPAAPSAGATPYRVLARKYRPRTFEDLIGQEAMVRTLSNAFETGRIPQAWMLTGVRGVGKTTTARILARGLNYQRADGTGGPTIDPCGQCEPCVAIGPSVPHTLPGASVTTRSSAAPAGNWCCQRRATASRDESARRRSCQRSTRWTPGTCWPAPRCAGLSAGSPRATGRTAPAAGSVRCGSSP